MTNTADDVLNRLGQLSAARGDFERVWRQVADVAAPDAGDFLSPTGLGTMMPQATAAKRSRKIYDSTAVWAVDRLSSGIEALIIPQSETWHDLEIQAFDSYAPLDDEKLWLERVRNAMFKARYDADSGWISASQTAIRRLVAFGNAFVFVEDGYDRRAPVRYRHLPLGECYAGENHHGQIDTFYRHYTLSARQALQKFGNKVSDKVKRAAESPTDKDRAFQFVQCIHPRSDFGDSTDGVARSPWSSLHVEVEERRIIGESGFFEFPIVDFRWLPEPGKTYGEGPVMKCLSDIQSLNLMAKNELTASQQAVDPPLLMPHSGVMNRPNTNPGAINIGGMSPDGRQLIQPLFTGQRLDFATMVKEASKNQVKESLYINLFATLISSRQQSATEAMIKANEKGELLGPAGSRLQHSLSGMIERELGILQRKGMFDPDSIFAVPPTLQDKNIAPSFAGQLSRLRRMKEAEGTIRTLQVMAPLAQVDPAVVDNFDSDKMARGLGEIFGMPVEFIRKQDDVSRMRQQRQQAQAAAQNAAIAKDAASAAKDGAVALSTFAEAGAF
jgi:hypothetical protein